MKRLTCVWTGKKARRKLYCIKVIDGLMLYVDKKHQYFVWLSLQQEMCVLHKMTAFEDITNKTFAAFKKQYIPFA